MDSSSNVPKRRKPASFPLVMWKVWYNLVRFGLSPNIKKLYKTMGGDLIPSNDSQNFDDLDNPLWLNQGYWKGNESYKDACEGLARLIADYGDFSECGKLLDVGFGFGEQDALWATDYGVQEIHGVNIASNQVEVAQNRIKLRGLEDRVHLIEGSATDLPFEDESFDKVVALECAVHFDTREDFFKEAFRVLKPGGTITTTDMIPAPGKKWNGMFRKMQRRMMFIPESNMYDRNTYCQKLESTGFVDATTESIREYVFPGMAKYSTNRIYMRKDRAEIRVKLTEKDIREVTGLETYERGTGVSDYALFKAKKPL